MSGCVINPLAPFPPRWRDTLGPIKVMAGPVNGYVMCRRPGKVPFVLHVAQLLTRAVPDERGRGNNFQSGKARGTIK